MTLRVHPAKPADVDAVAALELDCFPQDAWTRAYVSDVVAHKMPHATLLVAELDGRVVGHAIVSVVYDVAELQRIGVSTAYRRQGVARRLLSGARVHAWERRATRLLLEVRENNLGAVTFYRKSGFREIDRRPKYYADGSTAIVFELDLVDPVERRRW